MSESSARGIPQPALDPDDPGCNKQTMLDWLRINHPHTVIPSKAKKAEVADILRGIQAKDRNSGSQSDQSTPVMSQVARYPTHQILHESLPLATKTSKLSDQLGKRLASQELTPSHPKKRVLSETKPKIAGQTFEPPKLSKKTKSLSQPRLSSIISSQPAQSSSSDRPRNAALPSPQVSPVSNISNDDEKKELEALKKSIFVPLIDQDLVLQHTKSPNASFRPEAKRLHTHIIRGSSGKPNSKSAQKQSTSKPNNTQNMPKDVDLIQFSDTELFEVGNLVIGRDIPAIDPNKNLPLNEQKKTGADIFIEEQKQIELVRTLDERLSRVESSLKIVKEKVGTNALQELQQDQTKSLIEKHSSNLETTKKDIHALRTMVESLDSKTKNLQQDLDEAHSTIQGFKQILRRLLGGTDDSDLDEEYEENEENEIDIEENESSSSNNSDA